MGTTSREIQRALRAFYRQHRRDLPWRKMRDPYAIWISEILLQQTQVATIIPRYPAFLAQFPSVKRLAAAEESQVCEAFAGLGYYQRARNLHRAARLILADWNGELPQTAQELRSLPGIGDYAANAIASIAFGERVPAVDGNLTRVVARLFALPGRVGEPHLRAAVTRQALALVAHPQPGDINQALMDLGALVCTPQKPACADCPLKAHCRAFAQGAPEDFPQPKTPTVRKPLKIAFAWIFHKGQVLLEQRPLQGLWPGLWELPSESGPAAQKRLATRLGVRLAPAQIRVKHTLSHRDVLASVHVGSPGCIPSPCQAYVPRPLALPLSGLARKAILAMVSHGKKTTEAKA